MSRDASSDTADGPVLLSVEDGVATVRINRPDQGNAINLATAHAMINVVQQIADNPSVRVVILESGGRMFCAGGDVREMAAAATREVFLAELAGAIHDALIALRALPIPIIAKIHGTVAGAGIGLVLAADLAVAAEAAVFVAAYSKIGLSPDCGVTALLPSAIGSRRAAQFLLTGLTLDSRTAADWGLISESCTDERLDERITELAQVLSDQPGSAAGQTARLLRLAVDTDYAAQLGEEARTIARLSASPEAAERIEAFTKPRS